MTSNHPKQTSARLLLNSNSFGFSGGGNFLDNQFFVYHCGVFAPGLCTKSKLGDDQD